MLNQLARPVCRKVCRKLRHTAKSAPAYRLTLGGATIKYDGSTLTKKPQ